ncbi:g2389 [Coccomyxa elongata]
MHTLENTFKALGNLADDAAAVHTMTIIEEQVPGAETLTYKVFDFLPAEATAPITVATLITGGRVKGLSRERQLRRLPHRRCLLIGEAVVPEASQAARSFNQSWPCELQLLNNDCHSHTTALVQHLTGRKPKLEKLRPLQRRPLWM